MHEYRAWVAKDAYDGDTIRLDVDLGFSITLKNQSYRLAGINAPEVRGEEREAGLITRNYVRDILPVGTELRIKTEKEVEKGKYGRYIVWLYTVQGTNINYHLVEEGFAVKAEY